MALLKKILRKVQFLIKLQGMANVPGEDIAEDTVVLVRLDAIGDFIMSYGVFCEYRNFYRGKKIILICSASCEPLARAWNIADEVIAINMEKYRLEREYIKSRNSILTNISAGIVIQMVIRRSVEMEYIVGLIHSNNKIALSRDAGEGNWRRRWDKIYSRIVKYDRHGDFEIKKFFYLANSIMDTDITPHQSVLPRTECRYIPEKPYFVIAQGGSFPAKKWENEKYVSVGNYILEKRKIKCYLLGANGDKEDNDFIYRGILYQERVVNLTGETSILDSIEIIRDAEFVITNDTCFVHIAAAVNTKCICIAGGWHWGRFVPYDLQATAEIYNFPLTVYHKMDCFECDFRSSECARLKESSTEKKLPCISGIAVEDMIQAVSKCW
ncbi:MAG: glycosyltransferase family 9 protein [Lachnospiraceae bacterium]|nr:glycosyltransferase family 9 protein [Butyrivibrio sp.]MCM1343402.1 glycosyltransferase family 9 protein [Muribaculaceae bacterium]MCM1410571.1 glycosyltransferase family 9 protein [Lachnospiraceae bacterium]